MKSVETEGYIHARQEVHGHHQHRAHHELLSCPPHQGVQGVPELQLHPG